MNRASLIRRGLLLFSIFLGVHAARAEDFAALAPKDAYLFVGVGNAKALCDKTAQLPWGRLWADPEMVKFTQPGRTKFENELKSFSPELTLAKVKQLFPGQAAVWMESLEPYKPDEWGLVVVSDRTEEPDAYRALIDTALAKIVTAPLAKDKAEAGGESIFTVKWDDAETMTPEQKTAASPLELKHTKHSLQYCFPKDRFILAIDGDESIQRLLARAKTPEESLAQSDGFRPMAKSFAGPQFRFLLNVQAFMEAMETEANPLPFKERMTASGVNGFLDLSYFLEFGEKEARRTMKLRTAENPRGLAKAATCFGKLAPPILRAAPESPWSVMALAYDLPAGLSETIRVFRESTPQADQQWGMVTAMVQAQTGLSLEEEIIPALGSQMCLCAEAPKEAGAQAVPSFVLALAKAEVFSRLLEAVVALPQVSPQTQKTEFLGSTLYSFTLPLPPGAVPPGQAVPQPTVAIAGESLVFSMSGETVRQTVSRLTGKTAANYQESGKYSAPAEREGIQTAGYSFNDPDPQAETFVASIQQAGMALGMMGMMTGRPINVGEWVDLAAIPRAETIRRHLEPTHSYLSKTPDGVLWESASPLAAAKAE